MTLLTEMVSNTQGVVTATTKNGEKVILEDCAHVDVVFGLNNGNNAKLAMAELQKKAEYNEAKYYWIPETKISDDERTFAIPYAYFIK